MNGNNEPTSGLNPTAVLSAVLALSICIVGGFYIFGERERFHEELHLRLGTAAQLKASSVAGWRRERRGDGAVLAASWNLVPEVGRVLQGRATGSDRAAVLSLLETSRVSYGYRGTALLGRNSEVILSDGIIDRDPAAYKTLDLLHSYPEGSLIEHFDRNGELQLWVAEPLRPGNGGALGVVLLVIDPRTTLLPVLRDWSGAGNTGELMLVRREGDGGVYLTPFRNPPAGAQSMPRLTPADEFATVRAGPGGIDRLNGLDYRGERVVASVSSVPRSSWLLVAKIDYKEAFAAENANTIQLVVMILGLAGLCGLVVILALRRHSVRIFREKYEAELARREVMGRYDFLTRFANDAIIVWEGHGTILEVNERALELFGYTRDEFLGLTILDLKPQSMRVEFQRLFQGEQEQARLAFETVNVRKNGTSFPTEVSVCKVPTEGRFLMMSIIRDITDRKRAEEQIRRLNRLYAVLSRSLAAISHVRSEVSLFEQVCRIVAESGDFPIGWVGRVEPETLEVVTVARAGMEASYFDEITISAGDGPLAMGPTGRCIREGHAIAASDFQTDPEIEPWREAALRHGLRTSISIPLLRREKTVYVLSIYSREPGFFSGEEFALAEEVGEGLSFALDRMDLDRERELAETARIESEQRLELALEAANEGYWDWTQGGDQWYLSPRFYTMLGFQSGEFAITRNALAGMTHPDDSFELDTALEAFRVDGALTVSSELRVRHKDGHYLWISSSVKIVSRDEHGVPQRLVGTRVDVSRRKVLEQQFLQAQKMESVGRLAGGVAHDFNNYLTVINGYAALLLSQVAADSPLARPLDEIRQAGERSAALTRQLLAFSRKNVERREPLDLNAVIIGLQQMLRRLMGENVELRLDLSPQPVRINADVTHLEQVVLNLCVNARDAIQERGHVTIETRTVQRRQDDLHPGRVGPYASLTVKDDGSGMTPEILQHIFEPFFTTKDKSRGTGLGLATVYGIVEGHNGFIDVSSEAGKGSSFCVFIPCAGDISGEVREATPDKSVLNGRETLLLVEDQDDVRRLAAVMLRKYGYQVLEAGGGAEALDVSRKHDGGIAAVVSDVMMPKMNGTELVSRLLRSRPGLKVLYVSGYSDNSIRTEELTGKGAMFLPKPYSAEALASAIRDLLKPDTENGSGARRQDQ